MEVEVKGHIVEGKLIADKMKAEDWWRDNAVYGRSLTRPYLASNEQMREGLPLPQGGPGVELLGEIFHCILSCRCFCR